MKVIPRKTKDFEDIMIKLYKICDKDTEFYELEAFDTEDSYVGYLSFGIIKETKECELCAVCVSPEFLGRGVGSVMNNLFEDFARQNECDTIFGFYCPYGDGKENSKDFYLRNNYQFYTDKENFVIVQKDLEKTNQNVPLFIEPEEKAFTDIGPWEFGPKYEITLNDLIEAIEKEM